LAPPPAFAIGSAWDVSYDGSVIVGTAGSRSRAFRWTAATGFINLPDPPSGGFLLEARGVSGNGRVVVGSLSSVAGREVYRWTADDGFENLGSLADENVHAVAEGVSHDGSVVVGHSLSELGIEPFRWTAATGMVGLGKLDAGVYSSGAFDVSDNGSVIVGYSYLGRALHAFRWTEVSGMVDLGDLPGGTDESLARSVSRNGHTIVGLATTDHGYEAFVWRSRWGMRSIRTILTDDYGIDLDGWSLREAWGVSANGTVIVGTGTDPQGFYQGWRVTLPIPEPAAMTLAVMSALMIISLRRRRRVAGV
jgi:probable HAF family extracellular repeat protein